MGTEKGLPIAGVEKLIRGATDFRATASAKEELKQVLEEYATQVARASLVFCIHAKRTTVMEQDVVLVKP
ncbi:NFYB/HAP3 family transcription factor subunit [Candidatus Woesearchaeota archaeon]|nr:NFYB/HAP3 family transcription factor subunit [Candidatus Woesearchaeota archaeon]